MIVMNHPASSTPLLGWEGTRLGRRPAGVNMRMKLGNYTQNISHYFGGELVALLLLGI